MTNKTRYAATVIRAKDGTIRIRVARGDPTLPGDEELIEILYGEDEEELTDRAVKFARERVA
ncbi:MAG: hypothetical protein RL272_1147 [Candidatus Parcubacteria bacterium]|jgi:hypothetical protein